MTGERGAVLDARDFAIGCHAGQMQQQREPRRAFYQSANRRTTQTENEIALPVTGDRPISDSRGALADHDLGVNEGFAFAANPRARYAQCASGAEAGTQLAAQRAPALHGTGLVK